MYSINVFISHSWTYSDVYETLSSWLFTEQWSVNLAGGNVPIHFMDTSIPKDDPIHHAQNKGELQSAIYYRIANSNVVVIPTGMYTNHSEWIQREINGANMYRKPILAVTPRGQEKNASRVAGAAHQTVGWTSKSVASAVWQLGRG